MHLSPRDIDKLLLHNAGFVAQKRLARGLRLNYPESVALIATQLLELIRDGRGVAELMDIGRTSRTTVTSRSRCTEAFCRCPIARCSARCRYRAPSAS